MYSPIVYPFLLSFLVCSSLASPVPKKPDHHHNHYCGAGLATSTYTVFVSPSASSAAESTPAPPPSTPTSIPQYISSSLSSTSTPAPPPSTQISIPAPGSASTDTTSVSTTAAAAVSSLYSASPSPVSSASTSSSASPSSTSAAATASAKPNLPVGSLPEAATFKTDNGSKWTVEVVGELGWTGTLGAQKLGGDKCRSSVLGGKVIWNCGDMECNGDYTVCGFSMGPAFYGTDSVMTLDGSAHENVNDYLFLAPWSGDETPQAPYTSWGMDTSNVAAVNDTHGIAYGWEIWRGGDGNGFFDRGLAVSSITLGDIQPVSTRIGPLTTGPDAIQLGLIAILADGDYIYSYTSGGPSTVIVGRVAIANDAAFDASNYEFLTYNADSSAEPNWVTGGIPDASSKSFGATTAQSGGFGCSSYGSAFYNNFFQKYMLVCGADSWFVNFFVADNPWGPFSEQYPLLDGVSGYGPMAHPEFSPGGSHQELYISEGPNGPFNVYKFTFSY